MSEIGEMMVFLQPFTDELDKRKWEYRIQIRKNKGETKPEDMWFEIKTDGFREKKFPPEK